MTMNFLMRVVSTAQINLLMRLGCIAVYLAGLAGAAGELPPALAGPAQWLALFVLVSHTVEFLIFRRHVRLYGGSLAASVTLAILFGSLHWFPLLEEKKRKAAVQPELVN